MSAPMPDFQGWPASYPCFLCYLGNSCHKWLSVEPSANYSDNGCNIIATMTAASPCPLGSFFYQRIPVLHNLGGGAVM